MSMSTVWLLTTMKGLMMAKNQLLNRVVSAVFICISLASSYSVHNNMTGIVRTGKVVVVSDAAYHNSKDESKWQAGVAGAEGTPRLIISFGVSHMTTPAKGAGKKLPPEEAAKFVRDAYKAYLGAVAATVDSHTGIINFEAYKSAVAAFAEDLRVANVDGASLLPAYTEELASDVATMTAAYPAAVRATMDNYIAEHITPRIMDIAHQSAEEAPEVWAYNGHL